MKATEIRQWLRELFGSRLVANLEEELLRTRDDFETRSVEYKERISELRSEIAQQAAKIEKYEMVLLPMVYGKVVSQPKPEFDMTEIVDENSWAAIQARWEKKQEEEDAVENK